MDKSSGVFVLRTRRLYTVYSSGLFAEVVFKVGVFNFAVR